MLRFDHTNRGRLLVREGRDDEALAAFDAALAISDYDEAHRLRLDLLYRRGRYDEAIRSCDALIARGKGTSAIYELRGLVRTARKNFPGAIEDLTNAMALRPDHAALLSERGWLYIVSDAPGLALHDFEGAIALDPKIGDAYNGRGFARLRVGQHRDAVGDVERALATGEHTSRLLYNAARVYALAAVIAASEVRKKGRETVILVTRYQDRAAELLRGRSGLCPKKTAHRSARLLPADPALESAASPRGVVRRPRWCPAIKPRPRRNRVAEARLRGRRSSHRTPMMSFHNVWKARSWARLPGC